jgi:hypothetical protein
LVSIAVTGNNAIINNDDDKDSEDDEPTSDDDNYVPPEDLVQQKNDFIACHNSWIPLTAIKTIDKHDVEVYPFAMDKDNHRDIIFINYLLAEEPFRAEFKETTNAWKEMVEICLSH